MEKAVPLKPIEEDFVSEKEYEESRDELFEEKTTVKRQRFMSTAVNKASPIKGGTFKKKSKKSRKRIQSISDNEFQSFFNAFVQHSKLKPGNTSEAYYASDKSVGLCKTESSTNKACQKP